MSDIYHVYYIYCIIMYILCYIYAEILVMILSVIVDILDGLALIRLLVKVEEESFRMA